MPRSRRSRHYNRRAVIFLFGAAARNCARIRQLRDRAPNAIEAFARIFEDSQFEDDGTVTGRVRAVFAATEVRFVPGLHIGARIGVTGFRAEYEDPWTSSSDQVGHFVTAVRLAYDSRFLRSPLLLLVLGAIGDRDIALRLMIGHEKRADPPELGRMGLKAVVTLLRCIRAQYHSVTDEDLVNFRRGCLEAIEVGQGLGNSRADLLLSYAGWNFGQSLRQGSFGNTKEVADWIRSNLGDVAAAAYPVTR